MLELQAQTNLPGPLVLKHLGNVFPVYNLVVLSCGHEQSSCLRRFYSLPHRCIFLVFLLFTNWKEKEKESKSERKENIVDMFIFKVYMSWTSAAGLGHFCVLVSTRSDTEGWCSAAHLGRCFYLDVLCSVHWPNYFGLGAAQLYILYNRNWLFSLFYGSDL